MTAPLTIPLLQIVSFLQDLSWPESTKAPGLTSHTAQNPLQLGFFTTLFLKIKFITKLNTRCFVCVNDTISSIYF